MVYIRKEDELQREGEVGALDVGKHLPYLSDGFDFKVVV